MADYAASNTKRLKVLQTGPRGSHHMIFRFPEVQSEATMISQARTVTAAMLGMLLDTTSWVSAEVAHEGSEVFLPVDWGAAQTAGGGIGVQETDEYGRYVNFPGRSLGGSRVAFYLFNVVPTTMTKNNRLTPAENATVTAVRNALMAAGTNFVAIDQNSFVMKNYANTGINDAVAKKSRSLA
jgi:hypothetical protein